MKELSGGLAYHWRALRYRERIWAPFRAGVSRWLEGWLPSERSLLLVGPSAGHCLPGRDWFARFERICAVDPDPVARLWLPMRLGRRVRWDARDYLSPRGGEFEVARLRALLATYPGHAVLFCNLLGQLRFLGEEAALSPSFTRWKQELSALLLGRSWASFHDRLSGVIEPASDGSGYLGQSERELSDSDILTRFYTAPRRGGGQRGGGRSARDRSVLLDHLTGDLFQGSRRDYFVWQVSPGYFHLVEASRSANGSLCRAPAPGSRDSI